MTGQRSGAGAPVGTCERRGIVFPVVLGVLAIVSVLTLSLWLMSRSAGRELDHIGGFLRAVAVGEAGHCRMVARLESKPWEARWFKGIPDLGDGRWGPGRYAYLIQDGRLEREADLLIRAEAEDSDVVMYWRLRAEPSNLSQYRVIRTTYFTYGPAQTRLTPTGLEGILGEVETAIGQREANRPWADAIEAAVAGAQRPSHLGLLLGLPPGPPIPDLIPPARPGDPPVDQAKRQAGGPDLTSVPPPPPLPTDPSLPVDPETAARLAECRKSLEEKLDKVKQSIAKLEPIPKMLAKTAEVNARSDECNASPSPDPPRRWPDPPSTCPEVSACKAALDMLENTRPGCGSSPGGGGACPTGKELVQTSLESLVGCRGQLEDQFKAIDALAQDPEPSQRRAEELLTECQRVSNCADGGRDLEKVIAPFYGTPGAPACATGP